MAALSSKIDFVGLVSVNRANCNGDPLDGNRPRTDYRGYGEISDVCIKRKIRNRMQDMGHPIFVQSADRCDDGMTSLSARAKALSKDLKSGDDFAEAACAKWIDVRSFGQVFAYSDKSKKDAGKGTGVSIGVRGPVSVHQAVSVSPVEVRSMQITRSVNGEDSAKRASDTMGVKHFVRFGLYVVKGAISVQLASKTGFSEEDADVLKECLRTLFVNDASSARPEGSMEMVRLYWWRHNCKEGQYSSAKVHRSVQISLRDPDTIPLSIDDYDITLAPLEGLAPEVIEGV